MNITFAGYDVSLLFDLEKLPEDGKGDISFFITTSVLGFFAKFQSVCSNFFLAYKWVTVDHDFF